MAAAVDPLLVDKGSVAGEAVVDQRALVADDLDLRVQGGHLGVPAEADAGGVGAADPDLAGAGLDRDDRLGAIAITEDKEGAPGAFGFDLRL